MQKAKKYDWTDSNVSLFGSDTEKKVKKESAQSEKAWQTCGKELGLQIWRIVNFEVKTWPKSQYGEFFNGDSYIVLNTYKLPDEEEFQYDVHFWIGKYSTQDEYTTAAYKTVELDTYLDDKPIQHREVAGYESQKFRSYFESITLLKGGAESGFNHVTPEAYVTRLFQIERQSNKQITCKQIPLKKGNLNSDDVFLIDNGLIIYQYNGKNCSRDEKFKGATVAKKLKEERKNASIEIVEEDSIEEDHPAMILMKEGKSKSKETKEAKKEMWRVSDEDGSLDLDPVSGYGRQLLESKDVFVINTGSHVFCWIGKDASVDERRNALSYASNYVNKSDFPWLPISVVAEGREDKAFNEFFK